MDKVGRLFSLQTLRFRWHTFTGTTFQDLFADIMQNACAGDFQKVKSYGPTGDLKCDGYWTSQRWVFQCYGPVSMKERLLIAKIKEDLSGAVTHWQGKMSKWSLVHNDIEGLTANAVQCLDVLRAAHPTIEINEWAWPQTREQFSKLSDEAVADLFGYPPTTSSLDRLCFDELRPVVEQIAKGEADPQIALSNPPSVTKLEKNSLDQDSTEFLQIGRRRVRLVEEYFAQHHDPGLGDKIAKAMQVQYQMLMDIGLQPNEVLVELQRFAGWGNGDTNSHDAAVLAVITYFFDHCDIFEDPDEETTRTIGTEA